MAVEKGEKLAVYHDQKTENRICLYKELMIKTAAYHGTSSPQLLWLSRRLDRLLNELYYEKDRARFRNEREGVLCRNEVI